MGAQAFARLQLDRIQPEFRDLIARRHVNVGRLSWIAFVAVEEKPVRAFSLKSVGITPSWGRGVPLVILLGITTSTH